MPRRVQLRNVVEVSTGTRNPSQSQDETFVYVDVAAVDNETKSIVGAREVLGSEAPSRARMLIRKGDILVSTVRPNLNAVAIVPAALDGQIASTGFAVLRATAKALPEYLFFFARSPIFVQKLSGLVAGAMYPAVTDKQVLDQELPLPSLEEQRRTVDILSRADGIIRLQRQAAEKTREITPALFLDMFGDPATNPKKWDIIQLGDLIAYGPQNGLYKPASEYGEGYPILRIDSFYDGRVTNLGGLRRVRLSDGKAARYALKERNIVINRVNSLEYLGKSAIVPPLNELTVFESNMMQFSVNQDSIDPRFLIQLLQTTYIRQVMLSHAKPAINQSSINQTDVKSLPVILPPLRVQQAFAERVNDILGILAQRDVSQRSGDSLFQALLAQAFSQ